MLARNSEVAVRLSPESRSRHITKYHSRQWLLSILTYNFQLPLFSNIGDTPHFSSPRSNATRTPTYSYSLHSTVYNDDFGIIFDDTLPQRCIKFRRFLTVLWWLVMVGITLFTVSLCFKSRPAVNLVVWVVLLVMCDGFMNMLHHHDMELRQVLRKLEVKFAIFNTCL